MNTTTNSQKAPAHANKLAHWLDDRFKVPGTNIQFGFDPIISLIPGAGDWLAGALSSYFIVLGARVQVPKSILFRMGFNVLLDILIGTIPFLGDIFDFGWKANTKNAALLEKYQRDSASIEKQSKLMLWGIAAILLLAVIALLILIGWLVFEIFEAVF